MSISLRLRATLFACLAFVSIAMLVPLHATAGPSTYVPPGLDVRITDGPSEHQFTTDRTPTFRFRANNANATFECWVDGGTPSPCTSPKTTAPLNDGYHTFSVKATYLTQTDAAQRSFLVDHDFVPDTEITSGPANRETTADDTPTFTFRALNRRHFDGHFGHNPRGQFGQHDGQYFDHSDSHQARFECRIDDGAWYTCWSPYTLPSLTDGLHTFAVRAIVLYRTDPTPATRTFTVDRGIPETTITGGPTNGATTTDSTPDFSFTSSRAGSTFACSVDGVVFACVSPVTLGVLADGQHTFAVTATSKGLTDPTSASRTFLVDVPDNAVTPPPIVITVPAGGAPSASSGTPALVASKVSIASTAGAIGLNGATRLVVRCSAGAADCVGRLRLVKTIRLRSNGGFIFVRKTLANTAFTIPKGTQRAIKPQLTNEALRLVGNTQLDRLLVLAIASNGANQAQKAVLLIGRANA